MIAGRARRANKGTLRKQRRKVNPVRNSSGALAALSRRRSGLNPAGIILKSNPAAAAGPEGLWPGGSSGAF